MSKSKYFVAAGGPRSVVALDGPKCRTGKALLESKLVTSDRIFVPQHNPRDYELIAAQNTCVAYSGSMSDMLNTKWARNAKMRETNVCYWDYCGSVTGNKTARPLQDMLDFLEKTEQNSIIFASTFCLRHHKELYEGNKTSQDQIIKDFLKPLFEYCQFKIVTEHIRTYKREGKGQAMLFTAFTLEKDTSIDWTKVDFAINPDGSWEGYDPKRWVSND